MQKKAGNEAASEKKFKSILKLEGGGDIGYVCWAYQSTPTTQLLWVSLGTRLTMVLSPSIGEVTTTVDKPKIKY